MQAHRFDVVVAGAGATGAHVAGCLAEAGFKVALIDRQPLGQSGAQWINGVPEWMYEEAGLGKPPTNEIFSEDHTFTMLTPSSKHRISIRDFRLLDIDMRALGSRLIDRVNKNPNARIFWDTTITGLDLNAEGRPTHLKALEHNKPITIESSLFIDASGLPAIIRKNVPALNQHCEAVVREDLCTAAQEVCEIRDRYGAGKFLEQHRGSPGELLAWVGVLGGYSLMRVHVEHSLDRVAFLSGTRAIPGMQTGAQLIQEFKIKNPWVGARIFGGQRALPLRRPYTHLVSPGVALIGDSACQVYSSHGSGVGIGLIAAKMLSDTIIQSKHSDIGSIETLFPYASAFHQKWGALLGSADALRRVSQQFNGEHIEYMMANKLMSHSMTHASLLQLPITPQLGEVPAQLAGLLAHPQLLGKVSRLAWRLPLIALTPKSYPVEHHPERLLRYEKRSKQYIDALS